MKIPSKALLFLSILMLASTYVFASETNGTINSSYKLTKICKNVSCSDYGNLNWKPTLNGNTTGATAVSVTDEGLTGYVWGDEIGWVNLSPIDAGVNINPSTGALSGAAYASVGGWINFNPTGAGVTLVDNGSGSNFYGYAYVSGINGGWIKFDCTDLSTCIKTDWRSVPNRIPVSGGGDAGGNGNGGGIYVPPSGSYVSPEPVLLPEDAYQNFPGQNNIGTETSLAGGNNDAVNNSNQPQFYNPYDEDLNITNGVKSSGGNNQNMNSNNCLSLKNFSCVWQNKYFFILFPIAILILLILLGLRMWKKIYR